MPATTPALEPAVSAPSTPVRRLDPSDLREITPETIDRMSREELLEALRVVPAPFLRRESYGRMEPWDLRTLRRVLHLARRCYRGMSY